MDIPEYTLVDIVQDLQAKASEAAMEGAGIPRLQAWGVSSLYDAPGPDAITCVCRASDVPERMRLAHVRGDYMSLANIFSNIDKYLSSPGGGQDRLHNNVPAGNRLQKPNMGMLLGVGGLAALGD